MTTAPGNLVLPPEIKKYKALRLMNEAARRTLAAIFSAAARDGLELAADSATRAVVVSVEDYDPRFDGRGVRDYDELRRDTNPLWLLEVLPNMPASHFAILTKSGGPSHTVAGRDQARRLAGDLVASGEADVVIGADLGSATAEIFRREGAESA
jgi:3-oxoacyl-(acyl-carrier-protein) synthase